MCGATDGGAKMCSGNDRDAGSLNSQGETQAATNDRARPSVGKRCRGPIKGTRKLVRCSTLMFSSVEIMLLLPFICLLTSFLSLRHTDSFFTIRLHDDGIRSIWNCGASHEYNVSAESGRPKSGQRSRRLLGSCFHSSSLSSEASF
jgi:hypothetical protein